MEAKFTKRFSAFFIDILFLVLILFLVNILIPESNNIKNLNLELDTLNEQFLNKEISLGNYFNHYAEISHSVDKENVIYTIINIVFIIIYFIIIPYFLKGQTFGQKLMKIRVIKEDGVLSMNDLIVRNMLINGLGFMLISLVIIYLLPSLGYLITVLGLGLIQIGIIIYSIIGIIKTRIGLHDKVTNTKVINV